MIETLVTSEMVQEDYCLYHVPLSCGYTLHELKIEHILKGKAFLDSAPFHMALTRKIKKPSERNLAVMYTALELFLPLYYVTLFIYFISLFILS